jgi:hypothetical protein
MINISGNMGRWLIIAGIALIVIGIIIRYAPWLVSWFGKLPGDIHIEKEHTKVYILITSMIIISVVLTILLNLFRIFKK